MLPLAVRGCASQQFATLPQVSFTRKLQGSRDGAVDDFIFFGSAVDLLAVVSACAAPLGSSVPPLSEAPVRPETRDGGFMNIEVLECVTPSLRCCLVKPSSLHGPRRPSP